MTSRHAIVAASMLGLALGAGDVSVVQTSGQEAAVFRARADAVVLAVAVSDRNRPVSGLTAADFQLTDNGVPQTIASTSAEASPVDVTLVLDTSGSLTAEAFAALKADIQRMSNMLGPDDRVRLVTFATRVGDVTGQQPGGAPMPLDRLTAGGVTTFYDALGTALMASPGADRPQLVFGVTDGFDNASFLTPRDIVHVAGYSSAALYISLLPSRFYRVVSEGFSGFRMGALQGNRMGGGFGGEGREVIEAPHQDVLRDAATITGGAFHRASTEESLPDLFGRVLRAFRETYILRYSPRGVPPGGWHDVRVTVPARAHLNVRARKGYDGG